MGGERLIRRALREAAEAALREALVTLAHEAVKAAVGLARRHIDDRLDPPRDQRGEGAAPRDEGDCGR